MVTKLSQYINNNNDKRSGDSICDSLRYGFILCGITEIFKQGSISKKDKFDTYFRDKYLEFKKETTAAATRTITTNDVNKFLVSIVRDRILNEIQKFSFEYKDKKISKFLDSLFDSEIKKKEFDNLCKYCIEDIICIINYDTIEDTSNTNQWYVYIVDRFKTMKFFISHRFSLIIYYNLFCKHKDKDMDNNYKFEHLQRLFKLLWNFSCYNGCHINHTFTESFWILTYRLLKNELFNDDDNDNIYYFNKLCNFSYTQNNYAASLLHIPCLYKYSNYVSILLNDGHGINLHLKNIKGKTPFLIAQKEQASVLIEKFNQIDIETVCMTNKKTIVK